MKSEHKVNIKLVATFIVVMTLVLVLVQTVTCLDTFLSLSLSLLPSLSYPLFLSFSSAIPRFVRTFEPKTNTQHFTQ